MTLRRDFLRLLAGSALALVAASACKKDARCKSCGMRIDPASAWRTELVSADGSIATFDTPRCALQSWRSGKTPATSVRVQDYYDRQLRDGNEVRFVLGGDVVGPMGPDLVPVDPARVSKFIQDHGADRALRLDEVTTEVLRAALLPR
jgi:copper chaperone NosL